MKKVPFLALGLVIAACGETPTETPSLDSSAEFEFVVFHSANLPASWLPRANSVTGAPLSAGCSYLNGIGSSTSNGVDFSGFEFFSGEVITLSATSGEPTTQTMRLVVRKTYGVDLVNLSTDVPGTLTYPMPENGTYANVIFSRGLGAGAMVFSCGGSGPIPFAIDIKPGSDPNSINIDAPNSVVTVALLTTDAFDATTVDHTTLRFEDQPEIHVDKKTGDVKRHEEDVDGDGDIDLLMHVRVGDTGFDKSSTEGTLTGYTYDGTPIQGTDAVVPIWQVAHVSGGGLLTFEVFGDEQYGFNAKQFSDGSVQGQLQTNWEGTTPGTAFHMELNCLDVQGNQAYVGGHVTSASEESVYPVGTELSFWVEDNGEGGDAAPDRISTFPTGNCEDPAVRDVIQASPFASQTAGNIQVKGS